MAASLAGTAVGAVGAVGAGQAAAAQSRYQSEVARNNQIIANQNAAYAIQAGEAKATDQAMRERAVAGATRAALAASGMDVNSGSAADVEEGQAKTGQLDVERVRSDAALRAYGYRTQATNFAAESQLERVAARNDLTAGFLKAGGTLLSGAGSVGGKWGSLVSKTPGLEAWDG